MNASLDDTRGAESGIVRSASPLRRLGAIVYDSMLIVAVLMVATLPFVPFLGKGQVLVPSDVGALAYAYWVWECAIVASYFGFFWRRKHRTLGMQAWRLRIERFDNATLTWNDVFARLGWACVPWLPSFVVMTVAEHSTVRATLMPVGATLLTLGLVNYVAAFFHKERRAWHERRLHTRVVKG